MNYQNLHGWTGRALGAALLAFAAPLYAMTSGSSNGIDVLDAANGVSISVRPIDKRMSDGKSVRFWVWCGNDSNCRLAGPVLELGVGQQANVTLNMMMAPQENPPYHGHTIHWHGLDVAQSEDGVPETGAAVLGDNYKFSVDERYVGSHMYHCHVHTVKHLEMGMYAPLVVKAVDSRGNHANVINHGGQAYDYEWNLMLSSVDPTYHTATGDSTVFADYNPKYFLINGNEGLSKTAPAESFTATPGKTLAIRLFGIQSINTTFEIKDGNGVAQTFVLHNRDGFKLPSAQTVNRVELSPGQTADLTVTLPAASATWYPQATFKDLRSGAMYKNGTAYTKLTF